MFDLNDEKQFGGAPSILNGGEAGLVKNVKVSVEKKEASDTSNNPDYKVFFEDDQGKVNEGFYYHKDNDQKNEEQNKAAEKRLVGRVLSIAKSVLGKDYVFPDVAGKTSSEVIDILFNLVNQNAEGKLVNVYVTYGNKGYASQYLGVRYFDFIEPAGTEPTTLKPKNDDILERITPEETPDAFAATETSTGSDSWM